MNGSLPVVPATPSPPAPATMALRHEHEVLVRALALLERAAPLAAAGAPAARDALARLADFFAHFADRCHHAKEEQHLFPALERRGLPREGGPVAVMLAEHREGRQLLAALAAGDTAAAGPYATLLRAHIDKENGVLFPLAERLLTAEDQANLQRAFDAVERETMGPGAHERLLAELAAIEGALGEGAGEVADADVLDVRALPPRERHSRIFAAFDRLAPGTHFVLVNDHDPKPLFYQFAAERTGAFTWRVLEAGPEVWRVEIGKPPA